METIITIKIESDEPVKVDVKQVEAKGVKTYSQYARFFDESSPMWNDNSEMNLAFIKLQERYANDKLKSVGHIFLNEVYDMLGIPRSKAGQVVGWIYEENNPNGDNYVDFGLSEGGASRFVNGYEKSVLLDFNVDGEIISKTLK
ncbi:MAG: hypothetical protein J6Q84_07130 [Kiritimatiellae bacterium]|nr:hypothetical protein [Kiritimatiellia bacterium]